MSKVVVVGAGAWGTALALQDDARADYLNNYDNLVQTFELRPPDGYADMESFNRDLNAYLDRLHGGSREYLEQTLRGGTQSLDNLFGRGHDLAEKLRVRIDEAVAEYVARMSEDENHPLMKRRREKFYLIGRIESATRGKPGVTYAGTLPL